jgi:hypothetical protein
MRKIGGWKREVRRCVQRFGGKARERKSRRKKDGEQGIEMGG